MQQRLAYDSISPEGVKALADVYAYVHKSGLALELIELVYLRISQINNCAFCLNLHTQALIKRGVSIQKLSLLQAWKEAGQLFTSQEQAALAWAESVTLIAQTSAPNEIYQQVHREFTDKELSDLTIAIALMNAYNRLAISFRKKPLNL